MQGYEAYGRPDAKGARVRAGRECGPGANIIGFLTRLARLTIA
jgi:hypothetical protein